MSGLVALGGLLMGPEYLKERIYGTLLFYKLYFTFIDVLPLYEVFKAF